MADYKTIENELFDMAKRYNLRLELDYDSLNDKMRMNFIKNCEFYNISDDMVITEVRTRDIREALERVEHRLVEKFKIDPTRLNVLIPNITNVIHNDPATIVFWADGTKTVVKCQDDDIYDPEKGLAMAISKKALGNKGNYCNAFKKWLPEEDKEVAELTIGMDHIAEAAKEASEVVKKVTLKAANIGAIFGKGKDK